MDYVLQPYANYRGNLKCPENWSADVLENENTSLFLTNLPPDCTVATLLGSIRNTGKVYATVINPPDAQSGLFRSAAKLVFFDRDGVDNLARQIDGMSLRVGGYLPQARPNRIRTAPQPPSPRCRVLMISGPPAVVNERALLAFFRARFTFELEGAFMVHASNTAHIMEWRFGSYRCQAEAAHRTLLWYGDEPGLTAEERYLWARVWVWFGTDPCQ